MVRNISIYKNKVYNLFERLKNSHLMCFTDDVSSYLVFLQWAMSALSRNLQERTHEPLREAWVQKKALI